jgi:hypothetical protein
LESVDRGADLTKKGGVRRAFALAAAVLAWGCQQKSEPAPAARPSAQPSLEEFRARAVASALADVRSRLSVAAPEWQAQPLAFGRHLLLRVVPDKFETFSVPDFKLAYERPLPGAIAVGELAFGSLLVAGQSGAFRVDPGAKQPTLVPHVLLMPGTLLVPERRDPALGWAVQRGTRVLSRHRLRGARDAAPGSGDVITPEGYEGGAFTVLRDGAVLYRSNDGVRRGMPGARSRPFRPSLEPWRLLPGRRIDQAWAVTAEGAVELWQLTDRVVVVKSFALGAPPFDVAASEQHLAAVVVDERKDTPRRFRLLVFTNEGERLLEQPLPEGPAPVGENWAELAVRDRYVAISETDPFVAVGGPGSLSVFRLPEGAKVFQR